jgi:hypothetical protein
LSVPIPKRLFFNNKIETNDTNKIKTKLRWNQINYKTYDLNWDPEATGQNYFKGVLDSNFDEKNLYVLLHEMSK